MTSFSTSFYQLWPCHVRRKNESNTESTKDPQMSPVSGPYCSLSFVRFFRVRILRDLVSFLRLSQSLLCHRCTARFSSWIWNGVKGVSDGSEANSGRLCPWPMGIPDV
jgi:hypothetical protein